MQTLGFKAEDTLPLKNIPGIKSYSAKKTALHPAHSSFRSLLGEASAQVNKKISSEKSIRQDGKLSTDKAENPEKNLNLPGENSSKSESKPVSKAGEKYSEKTADTGKSETENVKESIFYKFAFNPEEFENTQKTAAASIVPETAVEGFFYDAEEVDSDASLIAEVSAKDMIPLTADELSFLKKNIKKDTFEDLIDNAEEYTSLGKSKELLEKAQNFSLEEPLAFLSKAQLADENGRASEFDGDFSFSRELQSSPDESSAAFQTVQENTVQEKSIFTVTDNRSTEEKIASLKEAKTSRPEIKKISSDTAEMTLTLDKNPVNGAISQEERIGFAEGATVKASLRSQIQNSAPDFVKAANIVLNENGRGTINMILKPESLGNVKVNLQITDKIITGHISVASKEAFEAFRESIQNLKEAFEAEGYDRAEFTLSYDSSGQGSQFSQENAQARDDVVKILSGRTYSSYTSKDENDSVPESADYAVRNGYAVDVVA